MQKSPALDLYNLLVTRDFEPEILDAQGKQVSDPSTGEIFSFDWKTPEKNYGTVVVLLGPDNDLQVYFGDNLGRGMEGDDKQEWYQFLEQMKNFATRNLLGFETQNLNRLKYTMQGMAAIKEGLFEGYYGTRKVSYADQPKKTRLMIKHSHDLGEGDARYRAIESLFVETANGERFKVPSRSLAHGRMLARHISEGGTPYDAFGQHITEIVMEMNTLSRFIRAAKGRNFTGEAAALVESAVRHLQALKTKAKHMISQRGYREEREKYNPTEFSDSEVTCEAIRDMFVQQTLDHRIEEALPVLARLAEEENKMREADEFECWANNVMEGTWALPDTDEAAKKLQDLMSKPLPVGVDAMNATEQLYDIFGDDQLFDELQALAKKNPDADARTVVQQRAQELGMDLVLTPTDAEAPSPDAEIDDKYSADRQEPNPDDATGEEYDDKRPAELDEFSGAPIGGTHAMKVDEGWWGRDHFTVDGWTYETEPEEEEDVVKTWHTAIGPNGERITIDFDPYSVMNKETFGLWLKLGKPKRPAPGGPLDNEQIIDMARVAGVARLDSKMARAGMEENLDTDGVMMNRPTNCSSESRIHNELNRLLELAKI